MKARPNEPLATWCEAKLPVCEGRARHRHHVLLRSQGGTDDAANTKDICGACHRWVHDHPAESYKNGLLRHREAS